MLESFIIEYSRYRRLGEGALAQVSDEALNRVPVPDGNSLGMFVRHISGNLASRFTDFLTTDGEKPWRHREGEFEERHYSRKEVDEMWAKGWGILETTLDTLSDDDLERTVQIRGNDLSVHDALARSLSHVSYHVGQMVLLARAEQKDAWQWLSVPKGGSEEYNRNPTKER